MITSGTHAVLNQSTPWSGANLFDGNRALQDALAFNLPAFDATPLAALGRWSLTFYMLHQPLLIGAILAWLALTR